MVLPSSDTGDGKFDSNRLHSAGAHVILIFTVWAKAD